MHFSKWRDGALRETLLQVLEGLEGVFSSGGACAIVYGYPMIFSGKALHSLAYTKDYVYSSGLKSAWKYQLYTIQMRKRGASQIAQHHLLHATRGTSTPKHCLHGRDYGPATRRAQRRGKERGRKSDTRTYSESSGTRGEKEERRGGAKGKPKKGETGEREREPPQDLRKSCGRKGRGRASGGEGEKEGGKGEGRKRERGGKGGEEGRKEIRKPNQPSKKARDA